jgi:purine-nucleoside phosphorylase
MSTVPEVLAARHLGIRCLALSCVTNRAAGLAAGPVDHEEVLAVGERVRGTVTALLRELLPDLAD